MTSAIDVADRVYGIVTGRRAPRLARVVAGHLRDLPPGARVLDVGAGSGRIACGLTRVTGFTTTACDIDARALGRGRAPAGARVAADGEALPFAAGTFDAVYLTYALHHVSSASRLLAEARRVVHAGGRLVVVEFDAASGLAALFRVVARLTGRRRCGFWTPVALAVRLADAGFAATTHRIDHATFVAMGVRAAADPMRAALPQTGWRTATATPPVR